MDELLRGTELGENENIRARGGNNNGRGSRGNNRGRRPNNNRGRGENDGNEGHGRNDSRGRRGNDSNISRGGNDNNRSRGGNDNNRSHGGNDINQGRGRGINNIRRQHPEVGNQMECNDHPQREFKRLGFKRLHEFLENNQAPDDVIMIVDNNISEWEELLGSDALKQHSDDLLVLVIHVMGEKICSTDCNIPNRQTGVLAKSVNNSFIDKIKEKLEKMYMEDAEPRSNRHTNRSANVLTVDHSYSRILRNIHAFYDLVAQKMPNTAVDILKRSVPIAITAVTGLETTDPVEKVELMSKFNDLKKICKTLAAKKEKEEVQNVKRQRFGLTKEEDDELHDMEAPNDFREIPLTPNIEELLSAEQPFLRTNKRAGAYSSSDHYLDVQFRLLREDFVQPVKKGIQDFLKNRHEYLIGKKKMPLGTVRLYRDVEIVRAELVKEAFIYNIQLSENIYKKIRWNKSKRLLVGSLLVFTCDMFNTAYFATVAVRDDNKIQKGILGIKWEGLQPGWDRRQVLLMVECEVYFEAYRHTLQILKTLQLEGFPMYKFIVESSPEVQAPEYIRNATSLLKLQTVDGEDNYFSPLIDSQWPNAAELGLDQKQYEAFKAAMTKEFVIIQGPPGTGKTFLGLKVAELLLNNLSLWKDSGGGPILVVCYTNHALDQFMEGILTVYEKNELRPSMIRVGGRSKSEKVDAFSLARQRNFNRFSRTLPRDYYANKSKAYQLVRYLQNDRAELMTELMGLNDLKGIVDFSSLQVWNALQIEFPQALWVHFQNLNWFGVVDILFKVNFSPDKMLHEWFNIKPTKEGVTQRPIQVFNADEPSDDEDYDLEELMSNRMVEEVYAEAETTAPKNIGRFLSYHPEFSMQGIQNSEKELHLQRNIIEKSERNPFAKKTKLQDCTQKLEILCNKKIFVERLFSHYNQGLLEINNVENIVKVVKTNVTFNFSALSRRDKWSLFFYVVERAKAFVVNKINVIEGDLMKAEKDLQEILKYGDGQLLLQTQIVGMTTTGAAKYNNLVKMMKSRIVIVEEAAEVLESHIVTCITHHCQHLILIGDHRQLRPSTTVYNLAKHYHLDLSLFERMINNNLNCYQLMVQHRMRPEIANLVVGTIYECLDNHESVLMYPAVSGVRKNLFFIAHHEKEKAESDSTSKCNTHEAQFLAKLCRYLVLQGYQTDRITVLTTYVGQMFLLKKEILQLQSCKGIRVTCVDNFQGEENDIILLSLVRSNDNNKIGFLNVDNRVCVAISRARHGLYICGNMTILSSQSKTWKLIKTKLEERGEIGESIDLECQNHGTITSVGKLSDFNKVAEGGCLIPCDTTLKCGHKCRLVCHVIDREHIEYTCLQKCEMNCCNGHRCEGLCHQPCKPCNVRMEKTLPCFHTKMLACHVGEESVVCMENVEKTLTCGHKEVMACHKNPAENKCFVKIVKTLECGHEKEIECHKDPAEITCKVNVKKTLPCGHEDFIHCFLNVEVITCKVIVEKIFADCLHKVEIKCLEREKPRDCQSKCTTRLTCGHACTKICHVKQDPNHLNYKCKKKCSRKCPAGLHTCKIQHECCTPCKPCMIKVKKVLSCGHEAELECGYDVKEYDCLFPCDRTLLPCNHLCRNLCNQPCHPCMAEIRQLSPDCGHYQNIPCSEFASKRRCDERVKPKLPSACVHDTLVPCRFTETILPLDAVKYCEFPCGELFDEKNGGCGHRCKGTCAECEQGCIHLKCQQECKRPLVCGHICKFPCSVSCPPCEQPCLLKCDHSECKRVCGEPCIDCNEKCTYGCIHKRCSKLCREPCDIGPCEEPCPKKILKCDHPCVGFCGDPCPPLCRICDSDELTEILFGYEDEEDARFVYLEDCKHSVESQGMDTWMKSNGKNGEITAKQCPKCKTLIRSTRRYGNVLKKQLENVLQVKVKIFGNQRMVENKLSTWMTKIHWDEDRSWERSFPVLKDFLISKFANIVPTGANESNRRDRVIPKNIGERSLENAERIAKYGEEAINIIKTPDLKYDLCVELRKYYKNLFDKLMRRQIPLSSIEVSDFDREFQRLHDLCQLYRRRSLPRFTDGHAALPLYEKTKRKLLSLGKYSTKIKEDIYKSLQELDEKFKSGLGISKREQMEILSAFNMSVGRWFMCPNGHIYIITECGGAMQEGVCNECGAIIGGGSHQLRRDNAIATEMDGAVEPLYPNMIQ